MIEAELPDGRILEFPDGTDAAVVQATVKRVLGVSDVPAAPAPKPVKIGAEGLPDAIKETAKGFSIPAKFAIGAAGAVNDMAMRLKQITPWAGKLTQEQEQGVKEYRALKDASGAALAGDLGMSMLATAVPWMGLQAGATNLAAKATPAFLAPTLGAAASGAAMSAATEPVLQGESALEKAALGAAGGAVGDVAARGLSRVVQPIRQSDAVKKLVSEGVTPTPGQAAGTKSFVGRFEQRLESLPILGDIITKGRTRAVEELNRAAINRSIPEGQKIQAIGRKAIEQADVIFDDAYRSVLSGGKIKMGSGLDDALARVRANQDVFLTEAEEGALQKLVDNLKRRVPPSGEVTADMAKMMDSFLGKVARERAAERGFAGGVRELKRELRLSIADGLGGAKSDLLREIDGKYANFMRLLRASGATGSKEGIFSPEALQSAVRAMDPTKRGFAKGGALMQDLSEPAVEVLGRSVADSGTAGRALVGVGLLGAGGAANEYYGGPGYLTALAAAPLLYSRTGSRYMIGDYRGQKSLADILRRAAPYASQAGRSFADD
jgi:hypothetical protein